MAAGPPNRYCIGCGSGLASDHVLADRTGELVCTECKKEWDTECLRHYSRVLPFTTTSHYCPDWDYLPIDSTCAEFEACSCKLSPEEVK